MKRNTLLIASTVLCLVSNASAQSFKPYWSQTIDSSSGNLRSNEPGFLSFLASGAFVYGYGSTVDGQLFNAFFKGIYRSGASYFSYQLSSTPAYTSEMPVASASDRNGNLITATRIVSFQGVVTRIDLEKFNGTGASQWFASIDGGDLSFGSVTTDSENNVYVQYVSNGMNKVTKLNGVTGASLWTTNLYESSKLSKTVVVSGYGNAVYVCGVWKNDVNPKDGYRVVKLANQNGSLQGYTGVSSQTVEKLDAKLDSLGNLVVVAACTSGQQSYGLVGKINTNFAFDWIYSTQSVIASKSSLTKVSIDNSGYIVAAGNSQIGTSSPKICLLRLSPSGQAMFIKELGTMNNNLVDMTIDRFGEAYLLSMTYSPGNFYPYIAKYSTAGTLRWSYSSPNPNKWIIPSFISVFDRSGEVLMMGSGVIPGVSQTTVELQAFQQPPVAISDGFVIKKNVEYSSPRPLVENDRFPLGINVQLESGTTNGTLYLSHTGHFKYTPKPGFVGTDTFKYKLVRPGFSPSVATVQLHVN